jgi:hypothetical protein
MADKTQDINFYKKLMNLFRTMGVTFLHIFQSSFASIVPILKKVLNLYTKLLHYSFTFYDMYVGPK